MTAGYLPRAPRALQAQSGIFRDVLPGNSVPSLNWKRCVQQFNGTLVVYCECWETGADRTQSTLFPQALEEYIAAENPVRFIDAFVAGIGQWSIFRCLSVVTRARYIHRTRRRLRSSRYPISVICLNGGPEEPIGPIAPRLALAFDQIPKLFARF